MSEPTRPTTGRKSTQRDRLLDGITHAVVREGYAAATIAHTIAHAGVSRPTFYDYFTDKDDCFLAAQRHHAQQLLEQIRHTVTQSEPQRALQSAVHALVQFAGSRPIQARFLLRDALAGGERALDERDRTIEQVEQIVERARTHLAPATPSPDLSATAAIGATHWLLCARLRRGESELDGLSEELQRWIERHLRPTHEHRRRALRAGPVQPPSPHVSELPPSSPAPLAPGRPSLSREAVARNQRERILYATAEIAARKGYHASTIADITAAARVDSRVFYTHFRDKLDAALAAQQLGVQHTIGVVASAFFSAGRWPERVWQATLAYTQFQASHPVTSHFGLVDIHAVGLPAVERIHSSHAALTIFLQEGNQHAAQAQSQRAVEAVVAASFEVVYELTRRGRGAQMARYAHEIAYLCLAPFLGPAAANELIDARTLAHPPAPS